MFKRFTERARRVVLLAQEEARLLNHDYVGTEHILLGLIREREGLAATTLESLSISLEAVRSQVATTTSSEPPGDAGRIPFTARARDALELSLREALRLRHNYIGTEHILLGLIRQDAANGPDDDGGRSGAARVLAEFGVDLDRARQHVIEALADRRDRHAPEVAAGSVDLRHRLAGRRGRRSRRRPSRWMFAG